MKISTKGRYALRLMADVAVHERDGYVSLKDAAARQEISVKYLEQIAGLLSKAGLLRSGVGVFGLLAVAAICLAPVLRLGLQYLLLKLAGGLCAVAGSEDVGRLASGFGSVCGMLLGLVGAGAAMLFVSLIMGLQAVTGL